jgi:WD40 repeat protein/DNA-binding SARP family transcriptional activator
MHFSILGPLEVRDGQQPLVINGPKPRSILAVLLLHADEPVSADRLAQALWGPDAPANATKVVQVHVSRLRKALGAADVVVTTPAGYRVSVGPGELDLARFEQLTAEGRRALEDGDSIRAAAALREGLALWRGPPLGELVTEPFAAPEIARLEESRLDALEARIEADLGNAGHGELVGELGRLVAEHPDRERFAAQLMLALYRCGRQSEALEAYQTVLRALRERGLEPMRELRDLQAAILRQDPSLDVAATGTRFPAELQAPAATPMFGRAGELAWLWERWSAVVADGRAETVAVIGEPGMGKTRLLAALAREVHAAGVTVLYRPGAPLTATRPTLVILDDAASSPSPPATGPVLAVRGATRPGATAHELRLEPLDAGAVADIARFYAGPSASDLPTRWLLEASGGVPRRVHELAGTWAKDALAKRVDMAAEQTAAGRRSLRASEAELIGSLVGGQSTRERVVAIARAQDPPEQLAICPFKGLTSFQYDDADYFFGREALVAELVARLVGTTLLAVVGSSGSGKSSLLRAGLLPALARGVLPGSERWERLIIRPGARPLRELESAVGRAGRHVIVVDQFEEVFTDCLDPVQREAFFDALLDGGDRRIVVLAIRADFLGRCAPHVRLATLLGKNTVLVGPMTRDELRRAIERPAERAGLEVEPELVDALLSDIESQPGGLPLLSTALLELWQHRDGRTLRLASYRRTGGVHGAVARLAEDAYGRLAPTQQPLAQRVLLQLTGEGSGETLVRRRVSLDELEGRYTDAVEDIVTTLADRRLLTVSERTAELAHEAVLREWPRLQTWLEDDASRRRAHRRLTAAAREWSEHGRDPGDLYRGARLVAAAELDELDSLEREFLDSSHALELRERTARRRRARTLRAIAALLAVLALAAVLSATVAVRQSRRAETERQLAISRSLSTQAVAKRGQDRDVAALMSIEAYRIAPTFDARNAVLGVLPALAYSAGTLRGHTGEVGSLSFSADGRRLVSGGADGTARVWDVRTHREIGAPLDAHTGAVNAVALSRDSRTVITGGRDQLLRVWDVPTHRQSGPPLSGVGQPTLALALTGGGRRLVAADGSVIKRWDLRTRRELGVPLTTEPSNPGLALTADGDAAAVMTNAGIQLWSVTRGQRLGTPLRNSARFGLAAAFNRAGTVLASAGIDEGIQLWDVATHHPLGPPLGNQTFGAQALAFSADGTILASAGTDRAIRLWDVGSRREELAPLDGHTGPVVRLAWSPRGKLLASASNDGTVRLWDLAAPSASSRVLVHEDNEIPELAVGTGVLASATVKGRIRVWDLVRHRVLNEWAARQDGIWPIAISADGRTFASAEGNVVGLFDVTPSGAFVSRGELPAGRPAGLALSHDGAILAVLDGSGQDVQLWDLRTQRRLGLRLAEFYGQVTGAAFSRDGRTLAAATSSGVQFWSVRDQRVGRTLHSNAFDLIGVALSDDGKVLASIGDDAAVRIWDATARRPVQRLLDGDPGGATSVDVTPDGRTLATGGSDGAVRVWDTRTRRQLGEPLRGHTGAVLAVAFGRDGRTLASAGADGDVRLWDPLLWSDDQTALRRRVCDVVGRDLTHPEWTAFATGEPYRRTCG